MPRTVSIGIATHNRAAMVRRAMESLRAMELPAGVAVELVVVANACTDGTVEAVEEMAAGMGFATRCVAEPAAGLSHARNRVVREAAGEIIAFIDDDVWVGRTWLGDLLAVFESQGADIVAGKTVLWWEVVARPEWLDQRAANLLSCTDYGKRVMELKSPGLAIGVNFAVRRALFARLGAFANLGRTPLMPLGGEDTEFFARALEAGFRMYYAPTAEVKHWVAPHRITREYLSTVAYSNGLVRAFLRKKLSREEAAWIITKYTLRWLTYCELEFVSWLFLSERMRVNHRIRRMMCLGNVRGTLRRLRGLSPAGAEVAPVLGVEQA